MRRSLGRRCVHVKSAHGGGGLTCDCFVVAVARGLGDAQEPKEFGSFRRSAHSRGHCSGVGRRLKRGWCDGKGEGQGDECEGDG